MVKPIDVKQYENVRVQIYENADALGEAAASLAAQKISDILSAKPDVNLVFSTGASQFQFMAGLKKQEIVWDKVQAFHLDEYLGMQDDHPASFRRWIKERIEEPFKPKIVHYVIGDADDPEAECRRYEALLEANPIDLGFVGIGENGHVAFNDPPVANFEDTRMVRVVELDEACRRQQLGEGWFPTFEDVPTHALTLTVPAIMKFKSIISVVPDARKAKAVFDALNGPVSTECPASILRKHHDVTLFLDKDSAARL